MRFQDLKEGLIKLPQTLLSDIQTFVIDSMVKKYQYTLNYVADNKLFNPKHYQKHTDTVAKLAQKYNVDVSREAVDEVCEREVFTKQFQDDGDEMKRHYPDLVRQDIGSGETNRIMVQIWFNTDRSGLKKSVRGTYGAKGAGSFIKINPMFNDNLSPFTIRDKTAFEIEDMIENFNGVVEHELTHYVQYAYFASKDDRQVQGPSTTGDSQEGSDAYHNSQIEFDPKIKSAITELEIQLKKITYPSKDAVHNRIKEFVGAVEDSYSTDAFMLSLKRNDTKKWKKAVKLIVSNIRGNNLTLKDYLKDFWLI